MLPGANGPAVGMKNGTAKAAMTEKGMGHVRAITDGAKWCHAVRLASDQVIKCSCHSNEIKGHFDEKLIEDFHPTHKAKMMSFVSVCQV